MSATAAASSARARSPARRPGVWTVYRWELRKLIAQKRTYLGLGAAVVFPLIFVLALALQTGEPDGVAFGRYVRESAFAIPLVLLLFGSIWFMPLVTALVAGDIVATEDSGGTLKTILTRSVGRGPIFAGKVLAAATYALLAVLVFGLTGLIGGAIEVGFHPLVSLSGTVIDTGKAARLEAAGFAVYLMPVLAVAAIGIMLSTLTRNSAAAVVGTLMFSLLLQLSQIVPGLDDVQPYLLPSQFNAWQGLLREPIDTGPIVRAAWVCGAHVVVALSVAWAVFRRRDVAGG